MSTDRIAALAALAAEGKPLFGGDVGRIVESEYWTARNGYRHLLRLVRVVDGERAEESHLPPFLDPARQWRCAEKRAWWAKNRRRLAEGERMRKQRMRRNSNKNRGYYDAHQICA